MRAGQQNVLDHFSGTKDCIVPAPMFMIMQYTIVLGPQQDTGGFTARCVEIPGAVTLGINKGEALANIKEAIELVREAQYEELQSTIHDIHSEIIKITVNDVAHS